MGIDGWRVAEKNVVLHIYPALRFGGPAQNELLRDKWQHGSLFYLPVLSLLF